MYNTYNYGNDYNELFNNMMSSSDGAAIIGGIVVVILIIALIALIIGILTIIINWKLLKKMGNEGWKALIPVYNTWSLCEGIGLCPHWAWIVVVAGAVLSPIPGLGGLAATVITMYFAIIYCISLARTFGKSDGFAALLFFFFPIAGFFLLSGEYDGPKACHDIVFDDWIKTNKKEENKVSEAKVVEEEKKPEEDVKYCPACGTKVDKDTKYCPSCGKEL